MVPSAVHLLYTEIYPIGDLSTFGANDSDWSACSCANRLSDHKTCLNSPNLDILPSPCDNIRFDFVNCSFAHPIARILLHIPQPLWARTKGPQAVFFDNIPPSNYTIDDAKNKKEPAENVKDIHSGSFNNYVLHDLF